MKLKRLGLAVAIVSTFGFSCHNEPNYPTNGMSNGPAGSGSGTASVTNGGPPAGAAAATPSTPAARPDSTRAAAKKRP
jgi:hypothetical protein